MIAMMLSACDSGQTSFQFDEMTYSPSETVFKLFAPANAQCFVVVGDDTLQMKQMADTLWTATAKGDHKGHTYQFLVDGQSSPGVFAKAVSVNGEKGVVVDLRDSDPEGWATDQPVRRLPQDIVVYEMHHRDFSVNQPLAQHPGKFLALTEPWAINHLKELGINAVHILPSYDYGSVDETRLNEPQYNWGYDPVNYNVPEGGYSTDPYDPLCRIREFKQMVQALHQAGIAVILDVVYNHTYDIDHSNFQRTYPDYYYRKLPLVIDASPSGSSLSGYSNGSGCGNETASEKPMMRQFMIESVKYWINEYHIDGFRFDLMGCHDIETMNAIRQAVDEIDPNIFIYGEGWSAGTCALPNELLGMKANIPQMPRIAAFSDDMRDALRGPFSDDTVEGWLGTSAVTDCEADINILKESIKAGIAGMIEHPQVDYSKVNYSDKPYATEPTQMMAYVSCHDDMCLVDRLKASIPHITEDMLIRLDLLAQTAVFTSQGVPFMLSGEELLRTKQGVHNSFESPDSINRLDWQNKERYPQVFDYYKNLIALRKAHPAFRLGTSELVRQHLEFLPIENDFVVAYRLKDHAGSDEWQDIIVILNADKSSVRVNIPEGRYTVVCCDGKVDEQGLGEVTGNKVQVNPQSALIIHN
ncbi:type I pullulanase [Prevotella sp. E2-28]|uniref:type I pullulanase n=1 Tax=Prevotella sp. E2-28 TaxID=2913620 RepID=UPI001EDB3D0C|nr:type I pullulanase [Prevotella sp. E2-28]UKK55046.1 type I pullulanase [Prevotella sp. E2-28]